MITDRVVDPDPHSFFLPDPHFECESGMEKFKTYNIKMLKNC